MEGQGRMVPTARGFQFARSVAQDDATGVGAHHSLQMVPGHHVCCEEKVSYYCSESAHKTLLQHSRESGQDHIELSSQDAGY